MVHLLLRALALSAPERGDAGGRGGGGVRPLQDRVKERKTYARPWAAAGDAA